MADRIVGGLFALQEATVPEAVEPVWSGREDRSVLFATARMGISWVVSQCRAKRVWLPAYVCATLTQELLRSPAEVHYYPVDDALRAVLGDWLGDVEPGDLVVAVAWFGRLPDRVLLDAAAAQNAVTLVDASQAWFTRGLDDLADWLVFSARKVLGVPDGGVVIRTDRVVEDRPDLPAPGWDWWSRSLAAQVGRSVYDRTQPRGASREWRHWHQLAEDSISLRWECMSPLTVSILTQGIPRTATPVRRDNHEYLAAHLSTFNILGPLKEGEVPLGFLAGFSDELERDEVRRRLFANDIYPMHHWPLVDAIPKTFASSYALAARVLTLICDHRYGKAEMEETVHIVRSVVG